MHSRPRQTRGKQGQGPGARGSNAAGPGRQGGRPPRGGPGGGGTVREGYIAAPALNALAGLGVRWLPAHSRKGEASTRTTYEASLELRKIYRVLPDEAAAAESLLRIVDESGEDYLYPAEFFVSIALPEPAMKAFSPALVCVAPPAVRISR